MTLRPSSSAPWPRTRHSARCCRGADVAADATGHRRRLRLAAGGAGLGVRRAPRPAGGRRVVRARRGRPRRRRRRRGDAARRPASACRGSRSPTRGSRWRRSRASSTAGRASSSRSSASPAPTARRRPRTCSPSIFEAAGIHCGRIGTVGYRIGAREIEAARTTPEAPELQRMLRDMVAQGCGACVMEVSSHALALRRADYLRFAAGDLHQPDPRPPRLPRRHGAVLRRQAPPVRAAARRRRSAITNADDPRGSDFAAAARRPVTYAIDAPADVTPGPISFSLDGLAFDVRTPRGTLHVRSPLVGRPNAYNILAAVAAAMALDLPFSAIETGHQQPRERARPLPGGLVARATTSASSSTTRTPTTR